jgi:phospholipase C
MGEGIDMGDDPGPGPSSSGSTIPIRLNKIEHFVVLMFENRSFDHLLGFLKQLDPQVAGLTGEEFNHDSEPGSDSELEIPVKRARSPSMPYDPDHEFEDIQYQLDPNAGLPGVDPDPMDGFVGSAKKAAPTPDDATRVMECFQPDQVPVLTTLAREFALFNFWHSSLPGPTFPNRFFVHAATSGGLAVSPSEAAIIGGFSFQNGTIYSRLREGGKDWRIYHDGFPQAAAIYALRQDYLLTQRFKPMEAFEGDVDGQALPEYTFIEPDYDTGHSYQGGNSMHPEDDVRKGEALLKRVYEKLRSSGYYWPRVMFIVVFDEHGGFYDHVPPPECIPPDDEARYPNPYGFGFDRLGVRVPAIVVSAYTDRGTVIGSDPGDSTTLFDHSSILATVEARFGLQPLTKRDSLANRLDIALTRDDPRLSESDALLVLPAPAGNDKFTELATLPAATAQLTPNQASMLALALACDQARTKDPEGQDQARPRREELSTPQSAAAYIRSVDSSINAAKR